MQNNLEEQETNQRKLTVPVEIALISRNDEGGRSPLRQVKVDKKLSSMRPMLLAISSAILVGSILGFIMLNMFTNIGGNAGYDSQDPMSVHADPVEKAESQTTQVVLKELGAYVLQGGVFSERENADEWENMYQEAGFPTVIFERDQQYFLLAGVADTEERAKKLATAFEKERFDVYVKEWKTQQGQIALTAEESHWLVSFQEQWINTLQSVSKQEGLLLEGWSDLTNSYPLKSEKVLQLVEAIHELHKKDLVQVSDFELQNMVLNIWRKYEDIVF